MCALATRVRHARSGLLHGPSASSTLFVFQHFLLGMPQFQQSSFVLLWILLHTICFLLYPYRNPYSIYFKMIK